MQNLWKRVYIQANIVVRSQNFPKTIIRTCAYYGVKMLVFRKILRTYWMHDPHAHNEESMIQYQPIEAVEFLAYLN